MQLPQRHGRSQWDTWAMVPKIYHFHNLPPILPILQKGQKFVLRLSEHGDVIETQTILYWRDMHNNMHITQSLFPQSF